MAIAHGALPVLERFRDPRPIVIAHRTCWQLTSGENSLGGLRDCAELGIAMAEIDLRLTRDGELMLMHDETLDRTTEGTGSFYDHDAAELAKLHIRRGRGGDDAAVTEDTVPTFDEVLEQSKGSVILWLDTTKNAPFDMIFEKIERHGAQDWVVFMTSFADEPRIPEWAPDRQFGSAMDRTLEGSTDGYGSLREALDDLRGRRPHPLALATFFFDPAYLGDGAVEQAHRDGHRLLAFSDWDDVPHGQPRLAASVGRTGEELLELGIDVVCTDDAAGVQTHLNETGRGTR
jgi:hypothetical protein